MKKRNMSGLTEEEFLAEYKPDDYNRPSVTVDIMIIKEKINLAGLQVLLIQRKNHPFIEQWALPGGFVDIQESAYHAARRELKEETDIENVYLEQIYTMSQPDRDPRMRVIDIAYTALVPYGTALNPIAGDDAKNALWFDIELNDKMLKLSNEENDIAIEYELKKHKFKNGVIHIDNYIPSLISKDALAFDHSQIILEGLMRLKNKVLYSDIAFNLVPNEFTLPDLQKAFETILGRELYKTNFRKKIADNIVPLNKKGISITGNKKSELYKYKT